MTLPVERLLTEVSFSAVVVGVTALSLYLPFPLLSLLAGGLGSLLALRALLGVWTLGFVRPGDRFAAMQARAGLYLMGVIALTCVLALAAHAHRL